MFDLSPCLGLSLPSCIHLCSSNNIASATPSEGRVADRLSIIAPMIVLHGFLPFTRPLLSCHHAWPDAEGVEAAAVDSSRDGFREAGATQAQLPAEQARARAALPALRPQPQASGAPLTLCTSVALPTPAGNVFASKST